MICEALIREALTPDPLDIAKASVRTRDVGRIVRERRGRVLSALRAAHSVPTERDDAGVVA